MPNWCSNEMTIYHPKKSMIKKAKLAWKTGQFLNAFIPIPEELKIVKGWSADESEQLAREKQYKTNIDKFGYPTWWEYCVAEWGTKWDVGYSNNEGNDARHLTDNKFNVSFDSAWAPPVEAYKKLEGMGFVIHAYYYEGGIGFCGEFVDAEDYCYDTKDCPEEIKEMFGIYELENEDES